MTTLLVWLGAAALWVLTMGFVWSWRCWRCRRRIWWRESCVRCQDDAVERWLRRP